MAGAGLGHEDLKMAGAGSMVLLLGQSNSCGLILLRGYKVFQLRECLAQLCLSKLRLWNQISEYTYIHKRMLLREGVGETTVLP